MKHILIIIIAMVFQFTVMYCKMIKENYNSLNIEVLNQLDKPVTDGKVKIPLSVVMEKIPEININNLVVKDGDNELAYQLVGDEDKYLLILLNLEANATKKLTVNELLSGQQPKQQVKRTQAELSIKDGGQWEWVTKKNGNEQYEYLGGEFKNIDYLNVPKQHTDHSFYIRYEGPGWESDKVGYRFYLDWRNAVDVFGKTTHEMALQKAGLDGFDSYHEMADWGMDIFKVGNSLGIGSVAYWNGKKAVRVEKTDSVDCRIVANGNLKSLIATNYYGWQIGKEKNDLKSNISILAGSRMTLQELEISNVESLLCTGIIKHEGINSISNFEDSDGEWIYMATYGEQSLAGDNLGLAVVINRKYLNEITADDLNHIMVMKPSNNKLEYYFLAAWEQEKDGIKSESEFINYLNFEIEKLNNPFIVTL